MISLMDHEYVKKGFHNPVPRRGVMDASMTVDEVSRVRRHTRMIRMIFDA